jgi:protein-S-isoprenylcysteine O-methyltransferase Ste14
MLGLSENFRDYREDKNRFTTSLKLYFILVVSITTIFQLIYPIFYFNFTSGFLHDKDILIGSGIVYFVVILFGSIFLLEYMKDHEITNWWKQSKNKKPNIIVEFIKAKYKKYCPQINWK